MNKKRGHASSNNPGSEWQDAFVTHSAGELRAEVEKRRTRGPNKLPRKQQVAVRYSIEVLAYFRSTGTGWQTRMDDVLREYVRSQSSATK